MKLRQSSRNSAKRALNDTLIALLCFACGCSSSTKPTYIKENIEQDIRDICRNEYALEVKTKLIGSTLWVYLPVEDLFISAEKPEKYTEKFAIDYNKTRSQDSRLKSDYLIKPIPDKEKSQDYKYNKEVLEKINNVWKVLRRVIFSMSQLKGGKPEFFCIVTADIKKGFELSELFYYLDFKKISYNFISWNEYQHRSIQDANMSAEIIGDKEGRHLNFKDIALEDFVMQQIDYRIRLKFQKPEVEKNADIDKEIIKIAVYTIKAYGLKEFGGIELNNLLTRNKITLTEQEVWANPIH